MTAAGTGAFFAGADGAGVCPAIHERLERRRAAVRTIALVAARRLHTLVDLLAQAAGRRPDP